MKKLNLISIVTSVSGLIFWFILAFPFENRNESYSWLAQIESSTFSDCFIKTWPTIITYRPLSQCFSWLLYYSADKQIFLIQLFNFLLLFFAITVLVIISKNKLFSALLFLFGGFIFISAYYYLFHVHGIFYSPLILYYVYLIVIKDDFLQNRKRIVISFLITLITISVHSYAVIIFLLYLLGQFAKNNFKADRSFKILFFITIVILIVILKVNQSNPINPNLLFENLKTSLYNMEVSGKLSLLELSIIPLSALWIKRLNIRLAAIALIIILSSILFILKLPVTLVLILSLYVKLFYQKEYILIGIFSSLVLFPAIVSSGAATKSSLMIPFIIYFISLDLDSIEVFLLKQKYYFYLIFPFLILIFAILSRFEIQIPVINIFTKPLLIEREKTYQLSSIIDWYLSSEFKNCKLTLSQDQIPVNIKTLDVNRLQIPPTSQGYLDEYIEIKKKKLSIKDSGCKIFLVFGKDHSLNDGNIKVFPSRNAGIALVFHK